MTSALKNLAVIPARGGSKRLPRKNVLPINEKPLIGYTIEAALQSNCFNQILLSSDNEEVLEIGSRYQGLEVQRRPDELAHDKTKVIELICHIVQAPEYQNRFDTITLLLPTCPFRKASDIQKGFELLDSKVNSVISMTTYEFPPQFGVYKDENTGLIKGVFDPCPLISGNTRSQDQAEIYHPNGGFFISWWNSIVRNRSFYQGKVRGYVMSRVTSVDIDNRIDLEYAEFLLQSGYLVLD